MVFIDAIEKNKPDNATTSDFQGKAKTQILMWNLFMFSVQLNETKLSEVQPRLKQKPICGSGLALEGPAFLLKSRVTSLISKW